MFIIIFLRATYSYFCLFISIQLSVFIACFVHNKNCEGYIVLFVLVYVFLFSCLCLLLVLLIIRILRAVSVFITCFDIIRILRATYSYLCLFVSIQLSEFIACFVHNENFEGYIFLFLLVYFFSAVCVYCLFRL